jgi:hypothetical protein
MISDIRDAVVTQLQTIDPDVGVYPYIPTVPSYNTFIFLHYDPASYLVSYSKTLAKLDFTITICTLKTSTLEIAQNTLDQYIDSTGPSSLRAKLELLDLDPHASHGHLTGGSGYAQYTFNQSSYLGFKFNYEVYTI